MLENVLYAEQKMNYILTMSFPSQRAARRLPLRMFNSCVRATTWKREIE